MKPPGPKTAIQLEEHHDLASFRRPMEPIPDRVQTTIERGVRPGETNCFKDPNCLLDVANGGDGLVDDIIRLPNEQLLVACLTEMPGVSAAMWDWWFSWHSYTSERYQLWHPKDHVASSLAKDRRNVDSIRDRWVGNTSFVDEYIGGELQRLAIRFVPPSTVGFDQARLDQMGVAVCARTALRRERLAAGHLIHLIEDTSNGSRMHSRFLLGDARSEIPLIGPALTRVIDTPRNRRRQLPDRVGTALLLHCAQEMNHLAAILPGLHDQFGHD